MKGCKTYATYCNMYAIRKNEKSSIITWILIISPIHMRTMTELESEVEEHLS